MSTTIGPSFTAGGLASNIDTNSIIDGLVKLRQAPIATLQKQESGLQSQISLMGSIASRLSALGDAARALGKSGVLGVKAASSPVAFTATPGAGAQAGSYQIRVDGLATAAKARSAAFASGATVTGGSLDLAVDGVHYATQPWADGAALSDVAAAISASGAPVSAAVLYDGQNSYLSITKRDTGYTTADPAQSLVLTETTTGAAGHPLGMASTRTPTNASFQVDGLSFTRTSNTVADALPGTTLALKVAGGPAEDLDLQNDVAATRTKLQQYVDAYNGLVSVVQQEMSPVAATDRATTLTGDAAIRGLQQQLQALGSQIVPGLGTVRSLADLGVKTNRDGSLAIDQDTLAAAVAREPAAVDALFSTASTGLAATVGALADAYTKAGTGILARAQSGLQDRVKQMGEQATQLQDRLDAYKAQLQAQFAAMEQIVSQMKGIGSFLTQQSQSNAK